MECERCHAIIIIASRSWYCQRCRDIIDARGVIEINSFDPNDPHLPLDYAKDVEEDRDGRFR